MDLNALRYNKVTALDAAANGNVEAILWNSESGNASHIAPADDPQETLCGRIAYSGTWDVTAAGPMPTSEDSYSAAVYPTCLRCQRSLPEGE